MAILLKALIKKYAPERYKKRTSPYFTDFEVWKSVRASYEHYKHGSDKKLQKEAGKNNCKYLVEKTCANSLRVDFVKKILRILIPMLSSTLTTQGST